jgi:hypothetical protein
MNRYAIIIILLLKDLESSVSAAVRGGYIAAVDELVAQAVRSFMRQQQAPQADAGSGSIGAMRDADDELHEIISAAMKYHREEMWRDISFE